MKTNKICVRDHVPFYEFAGKYLPANAEAVVVDIGAGSGDFADHLNLSRRYRNLFLLDGNSRTVEDLRGRFGNAIVYKAADRLPFDDSSVDYVHCSHMIEHLYPEQLHKLLIEVDRVLRRGGVFAVSTPMLWGQFYGDLTHVRPYHHEVLLHYLCGQDKTRSAEVISCKYTMLDLVYRYTTSAVGEDWESTFWFVDVLIRGLRTACSILRIRQCRKNAYTLILKKNE